MICDIVKFVKDYASQNIKKEHLVFYVIYYSYHHHSSSIGVVPDSVLATHIKLQHDLTILTYQMLSRPFNIDFTVNYECLVKLTHDKTVPLSFFLDNIYDLTATNNFFNALSDFIANTYIHHCTNTLITPSNYRNYSYQYDGDYNIICPPMAMFNHTASMLTGHSSTLYYYGFNSLKRTPIEYLYIDYKTYFKLLDDHFGDVVSKVFKEI